MYCLKLFNSLNYQLWQLMDQRTWFRRLKQKKKRWNTINISTVSLCGRQPNMLYLVCNWQAEGIVWSVLAAKYRGFQILVQLSLRLNMSAAKTAGTAAVVSSHQEPGKEMKSCDNKTPGTLGFIVENMVVPS